MCKGRGAGFSHGAEPQVPQHLPQQDTGDVGGRGSAACNLTGDLFVVVQQSGEAASVFIHTCWNWTNQRLYVVFPLTFLILEFAFGFHRLASFHYRS